MSNHPSTPPKRAQQLLTLFLRDDLAEEVLGDLEEKFYSTLSTKSVKRAQLNYWRQVFNYLRPFAIKKTRSTNSNYMDMFKHNLTISLRNFRYHKTSFTINLIGLSTGLASAFLIYLWINDEISIDKFHPNDKQLYQVLEHVDQGTGHITRQTTAGPMANALKEEFPEVEYAIASSWTSDATLTVNEKDYYARARAVSEDFFFAFQFELLQGEPGNVLQDKKAIVISDELAYTLFDAPENAVGKTIQLQHDRNYRVSGVFKKPPQNSSLQFDLLITFEDFSDRNQWVKSWSNTAPRTYVVMKQDANIEGFNRKIRDYIRIKTEGQSNHRNPFITKFSDRYLYNQYENGKQAGGRIEYVRLFSIIACFILLIACINFMNLSTARASKRIKEVGIKKTVGANRRILIGQYLSESTLIALFATIIAFVVVSLLLPSFNDLTGKNLGLKLNPDLILIGLGTVLSTGIIAGSYPALYLSKFQAATILKGKINSAIGEQWARKGLVVFQFVISVVLIVSVWVVYQQIQFVQTHNLGYDNENVLFIRKTGTLNDPTKSATFLNEIRKIPGVKNASAIRHNLSGHNGGTYGVIWPGKDPNDRTEFERVFIDYGVTEVLDMQMTLGRSFSEAYSSDTSKIIFNEAAIKFMGMENPIGQHIEIFERQRQIIGVVKDFHFQSFHEEIKPLFFYLDPQRTSRIIAKIESGREKEVLQQAESLFTEMNPGFPFSHRFLDDEFQEQYTSELRISTLSRYFAGLAIIISCLGLFGLATFTAERRLKEIGVRKVLGAGHLNVVTLLTKDFTRMVLLAIIVALPISYFLAQSWLDGFALHIALEWWYFVGAGILVIMIAWLTVGIQTYRASKVNPVECLKQE